MSLTDDDMCSNIAEAVQRAAALHAEALRQVETLLSDELDEEPLEVELREE